MDRFIFNLQKYAGKQVCRVQVFNHSACEISTWISGDSFGSSPLAAAARNGHLEMVKLLHASGATFYGSHEGATPLHVACHQGHLQVVQYLNQAEIGGENKRDRHGDTPMRVAAQSGHREVVRYLRAHKRRRY